jgi:asparagine synthase (glutamine-hydrolysing)
VYPVGGAAPEALVASVEAMCTRMAARGPDARGVQAFDDGPVFGHRRLSIIDLDARSNQPLSSADGRHAIVFNGEIYNYRELRQGLQRAGEALRTDGDTEVLLALYRRWGKDMLPRLRGMFSFAIWDGPARTLLLARDPYGIKPLYYAETQAGLVFASQVKALLVSGLVDTRPSLAGLGGFYLWGSVPEPWTTHQDIRVLPAGHWLEAHAGRVKASRSWYDVRQNWQAPSQSCPLPELEARVTSAVVDSVQAHRVADVPVSVFLSGGIDSGAITGVMAGEGAALEGITIAFAELRGSAADEVPGARSIARHYGIGHHVRMVTRAEFEADLPRILDAMDQPSIDGINTWFASKAAAERGYKVVLSGIGGDELFCGYSSFARLPRAVKLAARALRAPGAAPLLGRLGAWGAALSAQPKLRFMSSQLATLEGAYQLERGLFFPAELPLVMGRAEARAALEALGDFAASGAGRARDDVAAVGLLESTHYLRNQLLRDSDWASMAHSIELRTPLCDVPLLEALAPLSGQFGRGAGKRLLANSPRRPLAEGVVTRNKTGFGVPLAAWLSEAAAAEAAPAASFAGAGVPRRTPWARHWACHVAARWLP